MARRSVVLLWPTVLFTTSQMTPCRQRQRRNLRINKLNTQKCFRIKQTFFIRPLTPPAMVASTKTTRCQGDWFPDCPTTILLHNTRSC